MASKQGATSDWRPQHRRMRRILRGAIRIAFGLLVRVEVEGREHVPATGPLIVAANHFHFLDPLAVIYAMPWPLDFVGGFHMPFAPAIVRWIPKLWGLHRVRRGGSSRGALRHAEHTLRDGGVLGIFPEGGSWAAVLRPPRPGSAFLATRTQACVLPVGLDGVTEVFAELRRLRRATLRIRIGKPIGPFAASARGRVGRRELDEVGNEILGAIAELLPPEVRGTYSDDPELRREAEVVARYPWETGTFAREDKDTSRAGEEGED